MMQRESSASAHDGPVLLLHGGGVAGWMWDPLRSHLTAEHRLLVPDLPGHGRNAADPYVSHAETTAALAQLLEEEGGSATVVGFSLGAQLAVRLAAERPDLVDRVVVISAQATPMRGTAATLAMLGALSWLARQRWFAKLQARQLYIPDELLPEYIRTSAGISRETLLRSVEENLRFVPPTAWGAFPGDALILVGAAEKALMKRSAAALDAALPQSTLQVVDGCGHGIPLQRPAWLAQRIEDWLADTAERP
ncbi:alpha/beta fold hydrolase [Microbacterium sp. ZOR0019]|uniref:alpha/beta fold hydrolase n=1 Tax=Microbacterium sp. ZOR0019 TaxID=1339233 RepID=UPI001E482873|nr:alpha/beta hydrolase [Microbacterium sp. ZOR0019]